jgi:hypothetical protein
VVEEAAVGLGKIGDGGANGGGSIGGGFKFLNLKFTVFEF